MKIRHKRQAKELYQALLAKGQTWTQSADALAEWREQFQLLECDYGDRERIQAVLDWYCSTGCGAVFVPLACSADSFRMKFEQLEAAMDRLDGQQLRYFDDLLQYDIQERQRGTEIQKEHWRVMQRVRQMIEYIDDLANNRITLPKPSRNGHARNGKPLSKRDKDLLNQYVLASRELLWNLLMESPSNQAEFDARLMNDTQLMKRLERYFEQAPF